MQCAKYILEKASLSKKKKVRLQLESRAKRGFIKLYSSDMVMVAYAVTEGMHTSKVGNLVLINWENYEPLRFITDQSAEHIKQKTNQVRNLSKQAYYGPIEDFKGIEVVTEKYGLTKLGDQYYTTPFLEACKTTIDNISIDMLTIYIYMSKDGSTLLSTLDQYPEQVIKRCITMPGMYCVGNGIYLNVIDFMIKS